jgi:3-dehydroquinate synthetase
VACDGGQQSVIASLTASQASTLVVRRGSVLSAAQSDLAEVIGLRPALVAISTTVDRYFGSELRSALGRSRCRIVVIPTGEKRKSLETVTSIVKVAIDMELPRNGLMVGIGGGITLDMVGLAASLFRRGIAHVRIGTTLVGQVDAAIGLKCGVNAGGSKNSVGAFHPAELVLTDGRFLGTLELDHMRDGLAEIVKLAVASDLNLYENLSENAQLLLEPTTRDCAEARAIVDAAIAGMMRELGTNPYEAELCRRVDFGHTVSGAWEVATRYRLTHGQAVALDVALFSTVASFLGTLDPAALSGILSLFERLGIRTWHPVMNDTATLFGGLRSAEAHRGQRINLPLPDGVGNTWFLTDRADLPDKLLIRACALLEAHSRNQEVQLHVSKG